MFLLNSRLGHFSAALPQGRATLLPKLRVYFAEFLSRDSLVHLRILSSTTCVGLRYERLIPMLRGFSRKSAWAYYPRIRRLVVLSSLSSQNGFSYPSHSLISSTCYSVSTQRLRSFVTPSQYKTVREYLPVCHRVLLSDTS